MALVLLPEAPYASPKIFSLYPHSSDSMGMLVHFGILPGRKNPSVFQGCRLY